MPKKSNTDTIDFLYVDKTKNTNNKSNKSQKRLPKQQTKPKKSENNSKSRGIFDFDQEMIVNVKKVKEPEKNSTSNNKKGKSQKKKNAGKNKQQVKPINKQQQSKMQKKRQVNIKAVKWVTLIIIFIGVVIAFLLSPLFNIKQINILNNQKITYEEAISLAQIPVGQNIFGVNRKKITENIKQNPYVDSVKITKTLPNTLNIEIIERQEEYVLEFASGFICVDSKGYVLRVTNERPELPILKGISTPIENIINISQEEAAPSISQNRLVDSDVTKVKAVHKIVQAARNNEILNYITSIDITNGSNIILNLDTEGKVAYLGDGSNANTRILYLKVMLEKRSGIQGEAFIHGDLNTFKPYFREKV